MTKQLFLTDSYIKEIETTVKQSSPEGIITEETVFYAKSGGQDEDKGKVECNGIQYDVIGVEKRNGDILIKLNAHEIRAGNKVKLSLNWERRHKLMKYHTAAHILAAVVYKATSALITGNNIEEKQGRIDFNLANYDKEQIKHYEEKANQLIKEAHEVKIYELDREVAMQMEEIFKLKDVLPKSLAKFRIVEIDGVDRQACGGTHVKNTSEIGHIKIIKSENKGKDNRRVYFEVQ